MPIRRAVAAPLTLLLAACSVLPGQGSPEPPPDPMAHALEALDAGYFSSADTGLRRVVAQCTGEPREDDALLLLSVLHLDPRYRGRDPGLAAAYAARLIRRPDVSAVDLEAARGIYLAARDLGAPSLDDPDAAMAARVGAHAASAGSHLHPPEDILEPCPRLDDRPARPLPRHPGPVLSESVAQARSALDSVGKVAGAQEEATADASEEERLRQRVEKLEAELARIRKLLRGGE